ncbi:hypothetical protein C8A03DRAFT_20018, partial [Achaetomium macrosporum]
MGKDPYFLPRYLGGKPFLVSCTVANEGLSLTTTDALADTGANGFLFVSPRFSEKMVKLLGARQNRDFVPGQVGGYDGKGTEMINTAVQAHFTVQNRTMRNEWLIVVDSAHDVIIGRKWFDLYDVLVDSRRRRLLFPPEWEPDPDWEKGSNIPLDQSPTK